MSAYVVAADCWNRLHRDAVRSSKYAMEFAHVLGVFCLVAFPMSFFIERLIAPDSYNTLPIRSASALMCAGLLVFPRLFLKHQSAAAAYWVVTLGVAGIYSFTSMLLLNAAFATAESSHITIWVFQYIVALSLVIQLLSSWRLFIVVWVVGSTFAFANLAWIEQPNWDAITTFVFIPAPIYASAVFVGALAGRYTSFIQQEKLETAFSIGANIAHEIRTPLAGIRGFANGINNLLPELTDGYAKALEAGLVKREMSLHQLKLVGDAARKIDQEVEYSNTIIDMLLVSTSQVTIAATPAEIVSARACAMEAINRYPYANDVERDMIKLEVIRDFSINASSLVVVHMLFNLIKNATKFAMASEERKVTLLLGASASENSIVVRDTGKGISLNQRRQIFERFYTTNTGGSSSGIGLAFCKAAIDSAGGSIFCKSDGHSFTEFHLLFPALP